MVFSSTSFTLVKYNVLVVDANSHKLWLVSNGTYRIFIVYNCSAISSTGNPLSELFNLTTPNVLSANSEITVFLVGFSAVSGSLRIKC